MEHYLCLRYYIHSIGGEQISEIVDLFPKYIQVLVTISRNAVISTAHDLITAIKNYQPSSRTLQRGDEKLELWKN